MASLEEKTATSPATYHLENAEINNDKLQGETLNEYAKGGTITEHDMTPLEAIKNYPWAVFWCLMVSMTVVMEGYDTILIGNFFAYPAFAQKYGSFVPSANNYQLTAPWQSGLGNAAGVGAFIGALLNGLLVTRFGMKKVILGALIVLSCFITMTFMASSIEILLAGEILCGLP
jgi:SP family general alpha glucoside:H+ symporter-like MFS transporter